MCGNAHLLGAHFLKDTQEMSLKRKQSNITCKKSASIQTAEIGLHLIAGSFVVLALFFFGTVHEREIKLSKCKETKTELISRREKKIITNIYITSINRLLTYSGDGETDQIGYRSTELRTGNGRAKRVYH